MMEEMINHVHGSPNLRSRRGSLVGRTKPRAWDVDRDLAPSA